MKHKRIIRIFFLFFALSFGFGWLGQAYAAGNDTVIAQSEALRLDELERAAGQYAPSMDMTQGISLNQGLSELIDTGTRELGGVLRPAIRSGVLILIIVILTGVAQGAAEKGSHVFQAAPMAGALAITAVAAADVHSLIGLGREAIEAMATFSNVLLPTMAAAVAASGAPAGGLARQAATVLFSNLLIHLISGILIPLVYAYIAASAVHAAIGNPGIQRIAKAIKGVVTGILTTVLLAYVGYLTVSGVIAGTTDAMTVKTAKLAMSSMVPVVGGVLSDAAESVLAGAGILKNAVGVFGVLAILGVCLLPFLQMGIHYLVYKISAALSATLGDNTTVGLIDSIGSAFALTLGMTASCALLLLVSVISGISAAGVG